MNKEKITERLKFLGFTSYEAKAYIALLENYPSTRYELSKNSGVPRSAIYDVIRKLEEMGAVNGTYSEPIKYIPLPPEELFQILQRQFDTRIKEARESLATFDTNIEPGHLWNVVGYQHMIHRAQEMITRAVSSIYLSVWQREFMLLTEDLKLAVQRGIQVILFSFTPVELPGATIYTYNIDEQNLEKTWDHKMILVVDQCELLMGDADNRYSKKTAWTNNTAIVDIATNHIILDITLFGLRMNLDVSDSVNSMQKGGFENLGDLLKHTIQIGHPFA